MQDDKNKPALDKGKLTALSLALTSALAVMHTPQALAQTDTLSGSNPGVYIWDNGSNNFNLLIGNGATAGYISGHAGNGTLGTLTNQGTIVQLTIVHTSSVNAIVNNGLMTGVSPTSSTVLLGFGNLGKIGTVTNNGTITGGYGILTTTTDTSDATKKSTIGTVINNGLITSQVGIYNYYGSMGLVYNTGTLLNQVANVAHDTGIVSQYGVMGTVTNSGLIKAANNGILAQSSTISTLNNSGTIWGANHGIFSTASAGQPVSAIGALNNSGLIYGVSTGIRSSNSFIGTLSNSGTIAGRNVAAIELDSGSTISAIINSGLIIDPNVQTVVGGSTLYGGVALDLVSGSLGTLINSGTIAGDILSQLPYTLSIAGGTNTFGTLSTASGSVGKISLAADLIFTSGKQLLNDNISVNNGSGTVTNAAGILQVNNPLTIAGNYVQDAAATLLVGVSSAATATGAATDSGYGRLIVSGSASVEAGSSITFTKLAAYGYAAGQRFVVIQAAASGTQYNADTLNYSVTGGYTASGAAVADGSYSDLVVTIGGGPVNAATTRNGSSALSALFNYSGLDQVLLNLYNPALALTAPGAANRAGAQLSPAAASNAVINASSAAFGAVQDAVSNRIDGIRTAQADGSGVATGESGLDPALWGRIFGGQANQGERDGVSGYHANYGGLMLGGDVQAQPDWRVGGLFSVAHTYVGNDGDNTGSSAHVDAYGLTAYAGYDGHPWYVNLTAGVARQLYSTTRDISYTGFSGIANGSFKGTLYTVTAQAGYPLTIGDATFTPLAGIRYSGLKQDAYTETGGNGAALAINGSSWGSLKSEVGSKYERSLHTSYGELQAFVQFSWNHEFRDTALQTSGVYAADTTGTTAFTTQGASPLRNTAALSLGATLLRSKNLTLTASYTLEGASGYTAQTGNLTLRWRY